MKAATYFEEQLNAQNRYLLLPVIKFHYSRSENVLKYILYAEELGIHCIQKCAFNEGVSTLESLTTFVDEHEDRILEYAEKYGVPSPLESVRLATWYSFIISGMAESRAFKGRDVFIKLCQKAASLTRFNRIPANHKLYQWATLKSGYRAWKLWRQTNAGILPGPVLLPEEKQDYDIFYRIMLSLTQAVPYIKDFPMDLAGLIIFELLCCSLMRAYEDRGMWCQALCRLAFALMFPVPRLSTLFLETAIRLWVPSNPKLEPLGTGMRGLIHFYRYELEDSETYKNEYLR
jgi:hypothetical protein